MARRARGELVEVLQATPLFCGLTRKQLNDLAKRCSERHYDAGDVIVRQLEHSQQMVAILSGSARVVRDGRRVGTVKAGDAVGEMSLIDGFPCSASVIADTPVEALVLYATDFRKLLDDVPAMWRRLLLAQTARVRELDRRAATFG